MAAPVVLVTGASQGIGAAIARVFAAEIAGVRLALVARGAANLRRVAAACARRGAKAEAFACDVSDAAAVAELAGAVTRRWGALDVLVNNAGKFFAAPFLEMTPADFDRLVAANLRSVFLVSRAFAPAMARRGRGDIFNMSSIAGLTAYPGGAGYSAAKFGVTGL
ncbi:MAG TPA: SDR family NAD(P)-dependent oxidoreductase, partial [Opitutaceae bacterium]